MNASLRESPSPPTISGWPESPPLNYKLSTINFPQAPASIIHVNSMSCACGMWK